MAATISYFSVGELYSNDVIGISLQVGNAGGIRPRLRADGTIERLVLLTATPSSKIARENPYHDRVEGQILVYTGKGLSGDQEPGGLNKRLIEQVSSTFPIWCFQQRFSRRNKEAGQNRWQFLGLLTLLRFHQENQLDRNGVLRTVWVFELGISNEIADIHIGQEGQLATTFLAKWSSDGRRDFGEQLSEGLPQATIQDAVDEVLLERLRCSLLNLHPREFELIVKRVFDAAGYTEVAVTRYSQDGGIDVLASFGSSGWPVRGWQIQIQAKRWLHTVGRADVAELRGSLNHNGLGCLITTSHFSSAALGEATQAGKPPIALLNGRDFALLLYRLKINING